MRITAVIFLIFLKAFLFTGCKTAHSPIITSKKVAEQKGLYSTLFMPDNEDLGKHTDEISTSNLVYSTTSETISSDINEASKSMADLLVSTAFKYEGVRYKGGGTTIAGMDCSGLVSTTFKTHHILLPRSSYEMAKVGEKIKLEEVQKGDLVFFKTNGKSQINHVGLVTEIREGEIFFIHSSVQRGVIVSSMREPYYKKTFSQANRLLQ
jgi:cell wall-associated NlpC family hydrolase